MTLTPLVSIVLPTYNGERYLAQSLMSCINQTWSNLEIIVVVDGSTDGSLGVIEALSDRRVTVIHSKQNRGLPESLNTGFHSAIGDYFTWTSDDNIYRASAIETMLSHFNIYTDVDFVYSSFDEIDEHGKILATRYAGPPSLIWNYNVVGACFLFRRQVWNYIGEFNPSVRTLEDYEYWLRVSKEYRMLPILDSLYLYRVHNNSLTGRLNVFQRNRKSIEMKFEMGGISRREMWRQLADVDMDEAFFCFESNQFEQVPLLALRGLAKKSSYFFNRGVLSITIKSMYRALVSKIHSLYTP